jgi:hypothetical protein
LGELLPKNGNTINSFVPKGWLKLHTVFGDFNKDGIKDVAIVVIDSVHEKITMEGNRSLVILKGTKNGYALSSYCDSAFLCHSCGGVRGEPFESLSFDGNQLILKHIVGSAYRSEMKTKFRYQNEDWVLIGETISGCYLNSSCDSQQRFGGLFTYDKNYLTGKHILKEFEEVNCKIKRNGVKETGRKQLIKLTDYNITSIWSIIQ